VRVAASSASLAASCCPNSCTCSLSCTVQGGRRRVGGESMHVSLQL
jgi:hypothetical protein